MRGLAKSNEPESWANRSESSGQANSVAQVQASQNIAFFLLRGASPVALAAQARIDQAATRMMLDLPSRTLGRGGRTAAEEETAPLSPMSALHHLLSQGDEEAAVACIHEPWSDWGPCHNSCGPSEQAHDPCHRWRRPGTSQIGKSGISLKIFSIF